MGNPIAYAILAAYQTALRAIATGSGYHYDVASASVSIDPHDHVEVLTGTKLLRPFFVCDFAPGRQIDYFPAAQMTDVVPIDVTAADDATPLDPADRALRYTNLVADIERALTQDVTLGGLVYDVRIRDSVQAITVGAQRVVAVVHTDARVYRTYGSPDT